jgi:hypothetical protein
VKVKATNQIELSYANAKALVQAYENSLVLPYGPEPRIYKVIDGTVVSVSVVSDEEHYSEAELAERTSPYLAPEAWAGVR